MRYFSQRYVVYAEEPITPDVIPEDEGPDEGLGQGDRDSWWQEPTE